MTTIVDGLERKGTEAPSKPIGQSGLRRDHRNLGVHRKRTAKLGPPPFGHLQIQRVLLAGHPRIDHVVHSEVVGRTHGASVTTCHRSLGATRGGGSG